MDHQPPASLEAKTKQELRAIIRANNRRHGFRFHYFDFSYAQGKWHCWFEVSEAELATKKAEDEHLKQ